jgi:hypothetical protein
MGHLSVSGLTDWRSAVGRRCSEKVGAPPIHGGPDSPDIIECCGEAAVRRTGPDGSEIGDEVERRSAPDF